MRDPGQRLTIWGGGDMWTYRIGGTSDTSSRAIGESVAAELRDSEQWTSLSADELLRLLRRGLSAYDRSGDESLLSLLRPLYRWAAEMSDTADRFEMYLSIRHEVEKGLLHAAVPKPFVLFERIPVTVYVTRERAECQLFPRLRTPTSESPASALGRYVKLHIAVRSCPW